MDRVILFGVADNGEVVGQEVSDKKVIAFHVENERPNRPFCYKGRPYMRVESVTTTMPFEAGTFQRY
ncbi:MAG: hypothetical protein NC131_17360 [Roseburia sp.]|nr:hypothetical protein [Roseburia sp.]